MKKRLSLLLCVLLTTLSVSAKVIVENKIKNGSWSITDDKVLHINVNGKMPDYKETKAPWYNYLVNIKTVELATTVTYIGKNNFYGLTALTTVTGGSGVTEIGAYAFKACSKLEKVWFSKVKTVGQEAFQGCVNLQQAVMPMVETLNFQAFAGGEYTEYPAGNLQYVDLGSNIKLLNGDCLNNAGMWKNDGTPSVFMSNAVPPKQAQETTDWLQYWTFGSQPKGEKDKDVIIVVPPVLLTKYNNKPEYSGHFGLYHRLPTIYDGGQGVCGRLVGGEPIYRGLYIAGWWYQDGKTLHVGYDGELPSWGNGAAPWSDEIEGTVNTLVLHGMTSIADNAFQGAKNIAGITTVELPSTLKNIGRQAFEGCNKLSALFATDSRVTSLVVGASAFKNCTSLGSINGRAIYITEAGSSAFENCSSMARFEPALTTFESSVFKGCSSLSWVNTTNATKFGSNAFNGCSQLSEISMGSTTPAIGEYAFAACTSLRDIYVSCEVPSNVNSETFNGVTLSDVTLHIAPELYQGYEVHETWGQMKVDKQFKFPVKDTMSNGTTWSLSENYVLMVNGDIPDFKKVSEQPWYQYKEYIHTVVIKGGATHIGNYAFASTEANKSQIEEVDIPLSCQSIGKNAFQYCDKLEKLDVGYTETVGNRAFSECHSLRRIVFAKDLKQLGDYILENCFNLREIVNKSTDPAVCTLYTFADINSDANLVRARNGVPLAAGNSGQKGIVLDVDSAYVTKYLADKYWNIFTLQTAGEHGKILSSHNFGDGLWILYEDSVMVVAADKGPGNTYAEGSAQALGFGSTKDPHSPINLTKRVKFMGNITHLGWGFQDFPNLKAVELCPSITRLDDSFENCAKLIDINLENVDTIGDWTFARSGMMNVRLPRVRYIGRGAFYRCKELQTVNIGSSCEIREQAFFYCDKMTDINLADVYLDDAYECFSSCYKLKNVTFNGTYLPNRIFSNCFDLESIDLGSRVDSISFNAFEGCNALDTVYCANPTPPAMPWGKRKIGEEYYDAQAFFGRKLENIHLFLPAGFALSYRKADVWKSMTFEVDQNYTEDLLPTGGAVGENGTWNIDTDGILTIDYEGSSWSVNVGGSNIGWHELLASWMPFIKKVVVSDRVNSVPYGMAGEHNPAWSAGVESIELGSRVTTLNDGCLNYSGVKDVYCYAESCPASSKTAFDWDAIAANNATLHVVMSQGILERYQASKTWSKFPNIVADLTSRMPAGIFSMTNPEGLVMWFRVTDEAARTCETYYNDIVGKAIEYNYMAHYEKITVPSTVTYNGDTYTVTGIGDNSFYGCTNVETFILPESIERIGVNSFNSCWGVHEFTLPASVNYIGENAFESWFNIERFTVNSTTLPTVDENFMNTYWDPANRPKPILLVPKGYRDTWNVEPWNKWFNVMDPYNKGVLTYRVIPGADFWDYYKNDEEYMCIEGLMALGIITYQDEEIDKRWDPVAGDWEYIYGNVYYNQDGKKLFYLDGSEIHIYDGINQNDNIYYEFKDEDLETMTWTTGRNVDMYKGAAIIFPESNVQTDIYFTSTNSEGVDITYHVLDLQKMTCEAKAAPNGYSSNAIPTDVSNVTIPFEADGYVVTGIAADAFNSLSSLQMITLPTSIRSISANAFGYCENVTSVHIGCVAPPMLLDEDGFLTDGNNHAFENIGVPAGTEMSGAILYVPSGCSDAYNIYPWNEWFNLIIEEKLPEDVNGDGQFNLEDITTLIEMYLNSETSYDLDDDGTLTVNDITLLITRYLEK